MNKSWLLRGASILSVLAALSLASPAFAASNPEGPGYGKEPAQGAALTLACRTGSLINGHPQYVCAVSHIEITHANTTLVFRALTASQATAFNENSPGKAGSNNTSHDDIGTRLNGRRGVTIRPTPGGKLTASSEIFTISGAIPSTTTALTVAQYSPDFTKEYRDEGLFTLNPPVGQLPEVPIAAGLPIMGLGIGGWMWLRGRRQRAV